MKTIIQQGMATHSIAPRLGRVAAAYAAIGLAGIFALAAHGQTNANGCFTPPAGLVGWWRAESNVMDSVSSANGELLGGASFDAGLVGQAFRVNGGAGQLVRVPNAPSLNLTQHVTFEAWINVTAHSANDVILVAGKDAPAGNRQYMIGLLDVGDHWVFRAHLGLTSGFQVMDGNAPIATNSWYHAVMTYDGAEFRLYVNGVLDAVRPASGAMVTSSAPLWIGGFGTGPWNFNGRVDEVSLYNRALTTNEIAANYRNVANRCMEPPVIVSHTGNLRVNSGSNAVFAVVANGSPLLRYQWGVDRAPLASNLLLPGQTNATLTLTNVQAQNAGRYWVRVTNAFGLAAVSNLVLTVNFAPVANNQTVTTPEDMAQSFNLTASDPNQDLLLYTILTQPTNGTLSGTNANLIYTPKPNFFGADSFTFRASDGLLNSATTTVSIVVTPVNDPPVATSQIVATDEDTPLPLTLGATDADGDALMFQITPPAHGTLSGAAPNLVYTPHANYFGEDLFTYTVTDSSNAVSQLAAVSITVRPVNDAPVPRIELAPLNELPGVTNLVSIAPVCCAATLRLDGRGTTDAENDPLAYAWLAGTNLLSTDAVLTNRFLPGTHEITLVVSDGLATTNATVTVEIITTVEAIDFLEELTREGLSEPRNRTPLVAWLRLAKESFEHCRVELGVGFLELYSRRVEDRLMSHDPTLATNLINTAEAIIEAAPDCDPCQRLGRKDRRHDRDDDREDRDGRNDRDRHDDRNNDRDDHNRSGDRNSGEREQNGRDSKSEQAALAAPSSEAQSSRAELRPLTIETGAERSQPKSRQ